MQFLTYLTYGENYLGLIKGCTMHSNVVLKCVVSFLEILLIFHGKLPSLWFQLRQAQQILILYYMVPLHGSQPCHGEGA